MRIVLAAALLVAGSPAVAETHRPVRPTPEQAAAALQNPLVQDIGARALAELIGIVLDTRIGAAGALIEPDADMRPDATLRDLARRDDPRFEEHLQRDTRSAIANAGTIAGMAVEQADELKRTAARLDAALAPLLGRDSR